MKSANPLLIEKYQKTLAKANMGFWEWDLISNQITIDQGIIKLYEFDTEEEIISADKWFDKIHPEDLPAVNKFMQIFMSTGVEVDAVFRIIMQTGIIKYIRSQAQSFKNLKGDVIGYVGLNRDITSEHILREELNQSKLFIENIVDAIPDPLLVKDSKHKWIFVNKQLEKFMGFLKQDLLGKTDYDFFPSETADVHWETDNEAFATNKSCEYQESFFIQNQTRHLLTKKTPTTLSSNENIMITIIRDITEKYNLDSQFRLMVSLIDSSDDLLGFTDSTGIPVYANKAWSTKLKVNVGQTGLISYLSPKDQILFRDLIIPQIKNNQSWCGEISIVSPVDGESIPFLFNIFPVRTGAKKENIFYACSGSDLRELKKMQKSLISQSKMAALGEMAAEIAHEINNPLAIIQGKAQVLIENLKSGKLDVDKCKKGLEQIESNSLRIKKIIDSSRAFARQSDKDPFEPCSVLKLIEEACEICRDRYSKKNLQLILKVSPDVQYTSLIKARGSEIIQVLVNLLNNSFDAIKDQPSSGWAQLSLASTDSEFEIVVTDSGKKIPQEIADRMMDPFFTTKVTGQGTGLGLSLSKQISDNHNARLFFDKKASMTRFVFMINKLDQKNS